MQPAALDLEIYQGDTFDLFFRLKQQTGPSTFAYVDLTGAVPKAQIRDSPNDAVSNADFAYTLSNQTTTLGGCLIYLTSLQTTALLPIPQVWDLQITFPNGDVNTILAGNVNVTAQVTR